MSRAFLTPLNASPLASNPSGTAGDIYYNSASGVLRYFNGTSWLTVTTSTDLSSYAPLNSPTFTGIVTAATLDLTTAATATTATSYWVETGSDGILRPKTLANTRTEIVTTAAVNAAAATTVGTVTSGTWQATAIGATYIDSAIARLASPALTGVPTAPTATLGTNTTQIATTAFVARVAPVYQTPAPSSPSTGAIWVDSGGTASGLNQNDYLTKTEGATLYAVPHPFLLAGM